MRRETVHPQSFVTSFRHSAVLSVPAVLLCKGKQLHRPIKLIAKRFRAYWYVFNEYGKIFNCVNNKMLEYHWLLTALIYGLIVCFRSKLFDLTCPITNSCNGTVKQQITIKHFIADENQGKILTWADWQVQIANKHGPNSLLQWLLFDMFRTILYILYIIFQNTSWPLADYVLIRSVCALILNLWFQSFSHFVIDTINC